VLLHLYLRDGPSFVARLRGMFAIAVWDRRRDRLLLARDRFGIKPLHYSVRDGRLSFASELKALLRERSCPREVDPEALHAYLAFNSIPAPLTIYRAVRKLLPGHLLECGPETGIRVTRFARPAPADVGALRREAPESLAEELRIRLSDSVQAHLLADVPVGVLLSGGVDSSVLTALAAGASAERVSTFSIGFRERSFDELELARQVARRYGTDHHELVVSPDIAELMPKLAAAFDEPFADSSAIPTYLVSQLAAEHVKVVLSGEGGDELFGGYETYAADLLARRVGWLAARLAPLVERLPSSDRRVSFDYRAKRFVRAAALPALERHHGWKEIFSATQRQGLLREQWREGVGDPLAPWRARFAETGGAPLLARLQDIDLGLYLPDDLLVKTDRMSMANSLEVRVPYLDPVVAELALALPTELKVRGLQKKRLLRRAAAPLIPDSIARARKRGFSIPAAAWLRGELEPFARELLAPARTAAQGFFEPRIVTDLLDEHVSRRADNSRQLWGLMCFSLWAEGAAAGTADEGTDAAVGLAAAPERS
jgi:asparagine synthase (glutamine-hydrolysing)